MRKVVILAKDRAETTNKIIKAIRYTSASYPIIVVKDGEGEIPSADILIDLPDAGIARARNYALEISDSKDWICFIDNDVMPLEGCIDTLFSLYHNGIGMLRANIHEHDYSWTNLVYNDYIFQKIIYGKCFVIGYKQWEIVGKFDNKLATRGDDNQMSIMLNRVGFKNAIAGNAHAMNLNLPKVQVVSELSKETEIAWNSWRILE